MLIYKPIDIQYSILKRVIEQALVAAMAHKCRRLRQRTSAAERSYPCPGSGASAESARLDSAGAAERSYCLPGARGRGRKEQFHIQGEVAAWAQETLEDLFQVQGQEGWQ